MSHKSRKKQAPSKAPGASPEAASGSETAAPSPPPSPPARGPSTGKKIVFAAIACLLFFAAAELVLALAGVAPAVAERDPYVGFESYLPLFRPSADGERMVTADNKLALFNRQSFAADKPAGTLRIFTVGGSTTYGRPFDDSTSFSGWLRAYLEAIAPGRSFEVVNAGGISYASYRVAKVMEELAGYEPDLFVVYSGNNEFLERRTYADLLHEPRALTGAKLLAQRSRLYALGERLATIPRRRAEETYRLTGEVEELLDSSAGLDAYRRDDEFARRVLEHYRYNLQRMVNIARAAGAEVILVTIPVNEKDFAPFKAAHGDALDAAARERCAELQAGAREALAAGEAESALERARQAAELDPRDAGAHFLVGRALAALGRHDEAAEPFTRAIVEDVVPLRALPEINRAIAETARRNQLPLVDYRALLETEMRRRAGHSNLGDELFLDHVHPTVEANGVLGRALAGELARLGHAPRAVLAGDETDRRVARTVLARVDDEATARAYKNLSKVLLWAGQHEQAAKYVALAEESGDADWELLYNAGVLRLEAGDAAKAVARLEAARELAPGEARVHEQLGQAYAAAGDLERALAAGRRAVELAPDVAPAWSNLSALLEHAGRPEAAAEAAATALELDPRLAEAHNNLGNALFDLGRFDAARAAYAKALELAPGNVSARLNLGLVLGQLGEIGAARAAFDAVLAARPGLAAAHLGRGKAELAAGRLEPAIADFRAAAESDPANVEAWELLARSLVSAGRADESTRELRRAARTLPGEPRLPHLEGRNHANAGDFAAAEAAFERAVALDPSYAEARHDLATLYEILGRRGEALAAYRRALELDPRLDAARAGVERLTGEGR